jgi:hypothetical protein
VRATEDAFARLIAGVPAQDIARDLD